MKVKLISPGTKIPNLALMKLSAYHKSKGDDVSLDEPEPDMVYISSPFSRFKGIDYSHFYPHANIEYGGYGFNNKQLPYYIEHMMPDYSIFNCDYSMGYTTRGCIRSCPFCIVPKMEGVIKKWAHPREFWNPEHDEIMFLDNNWLSIPSWFEETSKWVMDRDLTVFEHGMDIRLVNEKNVKNLRELRIKPLYKFAFDSIELEPIIREKIKLLKDNSFDVRHEVSFYVYLDSDEAFDDALKRCNILKILGTNSFVMFNINKKITPRISKLMHWANRRWGYWKCDFEDYRRT